MCDSHKSEGSMLPVLAWKLRRLQARPVQAPARSTQGKQKPAARQQQALRANGREKKRGV